MLIILSPSKTMKPRSFDGNLSTPQFLEYSRQLLKKYKQYSLKQIKTQMKVSPALAKKTMLLIQNISLRGGTPSVFTYVGTVFKYIKPENYTTSEMNYAQKNLRILSGLYGMLRPLDTIEPYRLEMKLLGRYWWEVLSGAISSEPGDTLLNLASKEYSGSFSSPKKMISPVFLDGGKVVAIYSKMARGMMAEWCIKNFIQDFRDVKKFNGLGYSYDQNLSSETVPVFTR